MMILLVKEYLEEIHGYSLQEAAFIVTIPNNIAQFVLGLCVGSLGDLMIKKEVEVKTVRRIGAGVQILAILPLLILPFLPCDVVSYRATMVVVQVAFSQSSCLKIFCSGALQLPGVWQSCRLLLFQGHLSNLPGEGCRR